MRVLNYFHIASPRRTDGEIAVINIIIGIVFIVGGLSGRLALFGTNSPIALVIFGVGLVAWGLYQVVPGRRSAS